MFSCSRLRWPDCCGTVLRRLSRLAGVTARRLHRCGVSYGSYICYLGGLWRRFSRSIGGPGRRLLDMLRSVCCKREIEGVTASETRTKQEFEGRKNTNIAQQLGANEVFFLCIKMSCHSLLFVGWRGFQKHDAPNHLHKVAKSKYLSV